MGAGTALAAVLWLSVVGTALAGWNQPVSQAINTGPNPTSGVIADIGQIPTVALADSNGSNLQIRVAQLGPGFWSPVGDSLNVSPSDDARSPSIARVGGALDVAFNENFSGTNKIVVKSFNGTSWGPVGSPFTANGNASGGAFAPSMASFGVLNPVPRVAWSELNNSAVPQVWVADFSIVNGFQNVGTGQPLNANSTHSALTPKLANVGGTGYAAWSENGVASQVFVKKLAGGAWTSVGTQPLNADPTHDAFNPSLENVAGVPYVAWSEAVTGGGSAIRVVRLRGNGWIPVGQPLNLEPGLNATAPQLASIGGVPFVAWTQATGGAKQIRVAQLSGSDWTLVGPPVNVNSAEDADGVSLTSVGGVPYTAFGQVTSGVRVSRLEPDFLSHSSIATDSSALLTVRVRDYGVPLSVGFESGPGSGFGTSSALQTTGGTGSDTLTQGLTDLSPATGYSWRAFGSDGARKTGIGPTQIFTTQAANTGPAGAQGPQGPLGPQGATGPRGQAGRDAKVTCSIKKDKRKKAQRVTCTVRLVSAQRSRARAALVRRGRTYARGRLDSRGRLSMRVVGRLVPGRYQLVLTHRGRGGATKVERHEVQIR